MKYNLPTPISSHVALKKKNHLRSPLEPLCSKTMPSSTKGLSGHFTTKRKNSDISLGPNKACYGLPKGCTVHTPAGVFYESTNKFVPSTEGETKLENMTHNQSTMQESSQMPFSPHTPSVPTKRFPPFHYCGSAESNETVHRKASSSARSCEFLFTHFNECTQLSSNRLSFHI